MALRCARTEYENLHKVGAVFVCVCVMWCVSPACRIPLFYSSSNDFDFNKKVTTNEAPVEEPTSKGCYNQTLGSTLSLKYHQSLKWFTKLKSKKPTRCHLLFYCTSYRLNMFWALLCPSSGARDYNVDYHIGRFVLGLL